MPSASLRVHRSLCAPQVTLGEAAVDHRLCLCLSAVAHAATATTGIVRAPFWRPTPAWGGSCLRGGVASWSGSTKNSLACHHRARNGAPHPAPRQPLPPCAAAFPECAAPGGDLYPLWRTSVCGSEPPHQVWGARSVGRGGEHERGAGRQEEGAAGCSNANWERLRRGGCAHGVARRPLGATSARQRDGSCAFCPCPPVAVGTE